MNIKILGTGCAKCKQTTKLIHSVLDEHGISADVEKIEDIEEIIKYDLLSTPGVLIDGEMKSKGRVPSREEIKQWIGATNSKEENSCCSSESDKDESSCCTTTPSDKSVSEGSSCCC